MTNSTCKGMCKGIPHSMSNIKRYKDGQKFCVECNKFFRSNESRCNCCHEIFRTKPRYNKDEDRWLKAY